MKDFGFMNDMLLETESWKKTEYPNGLEAFMA
jgi:hypothetical protein